VRAYITKLGDSAVRLEAQQAVTEALCRWTREFNLFGEFLLQSMNDIVRNWKHYSLLELIFV
jgi:hypothetical protein